MNCPHTTNSQIAGGPIVGAARYLDKTANTEISVLGSRQPQADSSYYHILLDVLLQPVPDVTDAGNDDEASDNHVVAVPGLHKGSALDLVLAHFCPAYHRYLRRYLEMSHSVTGLGAVQLGMETEVFLKALLALQQLVSRPVETTRVSKGQQTTNTQTATDCSTLKQWIQLCSPTREFAFSFTADQEAELASLSLLQRLIIQNLVFGVLGWTSEGRELSVSYSKIQRHSTGHEFLNLVVSTPDNLMGRILASSIKGPRFAAGQDLKLEGSGLGYHLAASLMAQLQGEIVVATDDCGGTCLELQFPLQSQTERYLEPGFIPGDELTLMDPGSAVPV